MRRPSSQAARALAAGALALTLVACGGCRPKAAPSAPSGPTPSPASRAPSAPAAVEGGPSVQAGPVEGWSLQERPRPGIAYRYIRDQSEGDFRPTVTVVARGAEAAGPTAVYERARQELRGRYPNLEILADRELADWRPPLHQTEYRLSEAGVTYRILQLHFVRGSGEVVVVTFTAAASQWEFLQREFQSILSAIAVEP